MKTILVDAINTLFIKGEGIDSRIFTLLESFPNEKIILTNADEDKIKEFGLDKISYQVFTLKNNPNKSNPEYYKIMFSSLNLRPENVVYFEHNKEAVQRAESVGINTYYFDPEKRDLESLKDFLDKELKK